MSLYLTLSRLHVASVAFWKDRRANVGLMFGIAAIPVLGCTAFGIDYGINLNGKYKLDAAADAASMVAINAAKDVIANSSLPGPLTTANAIAEGKRQAQLAFAANAGSVAFTAVPTPTIDVTRVGQKFTATVTYATRNTSQVAGMLGIKQLAMTGTSVSSLTMPTYINYYIITDISQSMGVASNADNMAALYARIIKTGNYDSTSNRDNKIGCVFGCHVQQTSGGLTQTDTNENIAHNSKYGSYINLRIDSAKSAIQTILTDATTANSQSGLSLVQIGIYTMQQDPSKSGSYVQNIVSPPSSTFAASSVLVSKNMDLGTNNGGGSGDSNFTASLNYFTSNILGAQGDGSTASSPLNYVFIITDGISDIPGSCTDGHCTAAFDDSSCTQVKTKATVGVIYTTYNPIYYKNDSSQGFVDTYRDLVANNVGAVPGNLKACASGSQFYYEASDGDAITTGMQKLFAPTLQAARLTQ